MDGVGVSLTHPGPQPTDPAPALPLTRADEHRLYELRAAALGYSDPAARPEYMRTEAARVQAVQEQAQHGRLAPAPAAELEDLERRFAFFIEEGRRRMEAGAAQLQPTMVTNSSAAGTSTARRPARRHSTTGDVWSNPSSCTSPPPGDARFAAAEPIATPTPSSRGGSRASGGDGPSLNDVGRSLMKGAVFWGSLVATAAPGIVGRRLGMTEGFRHWDWVTPQIALGALPVMTAVGSAGNHLELVRQQAADRNRIIGLVVSCLTPEEMEGYGVGLCQFATHDDWRRICGTQRFAQLPIQDFGAVGGDFQAVSEVCAAVDAAITEGLAVYVHCKAGKGRSWMVLMCYLCTLGGLDFNAAVRLIKAARHQVSPAATQQQFVRDFVPYVRFNMDAARLRGAALKRSPAGASPAAVPGPCHADPQGQGELHRLGLAGTGAAAAAVAERAAALAAREVPSPSPPPTASAASASPSPAGSRAASGGNAASPGPPSGAPPPVPPLAGLAPAYEPGAGSAPASGVSTPPPSGDAGFASWIDVAPAASEAAPNVL